MSSNPASVGRPIVCARCQRSFNRLSTHISQSTICKLHYTESHDSNRIILDNAGYPVNAHCSLVQTAASHFSMYNKAHANEAASTQLEHAEFAQPHRRMSIPAIGEKPPQIQVDTSSGMAFDDEFFPVLDNLLDDDIPGDVTYETEDDGQPDAGVLELCELLTSLSSNPLDLVARFSQEEKVHIALLQLLKGLTCSLNAFTQILNPRGFRICRVDSDGCCVTWAQSTLLCCTRMIDDLHQNRKTRAYSIEEDYEPERAAAAAVEQMQLLRASEIKKRKKR